MEHWQCPYCGRDTTLNKDDIDHQRVKRSGGACDWPRLATEIKRCPSPACRKFEIAVTVEHGLSFDFPHELPKRKTYILEPSSIARPLHKSVPERIVKDYNEACAIIAQSPQASATLSRRVLQAMVRDFWGVQDKRSLYDEINAIRDKIDVELFAAIDSVRKIGNIGAHMSEDVNTILTVGSNEAELLIQLIEMLGKEWYGQQYERKCRLKELDECAQRLDQNKS